MKIQVNLVLIVTFIYFNLHLFAQPIINFRITELYPVTINDSDYVEQLQTLGRLNLKTMNLEELLNDYIVNNMDIIWDPSENYAVINLDEKENLIYNLQSNQVVDKNYDWHNLIAVLFEQNLNKLFVFSSDFKEELPVLLSVYDINNGQVLDTVRISAYAGDRNFICFPKPNIFFSNDKQYIYIATNDTTTFRWQLWKYSLELNSIVSKQDLSIFGYPNMYGYSMSFGENGKGIICSFNDYKEPVRTLYYNVYDFDNNSTSDFVYKKTIDNSYYLADNGKYLILISSVGDSSISEHHTGQTEIYNPENGELLKSINLPDSGIVYYFEDFPNNIYYIKDVELPTRQIYTLKMDSIFNVLDLTSLSPTSEIVYSPSFTLTVNGKGFDSVSTVYFNGQPKTTTFISDSLLTAEIPSSDITIAGSFPVWVKDRYSISDTLQFSVTQTSNPNLLVNLKNSQGTQIPASNVKYYEGSWKDAVNNGDGTFTVITTRPKVSIRVYYEYASQQADNVTAQNNTYTFQTVNAAVELKNSLGNLIDAGTVQYYAGAWRNFGTTTNGVAYKELLPINYSFRMTYEYGSIDKQQNLSVDPTVVFQTVNAAVQLKNSLGNLIDAGTVQYSAGAWRSFGTTSNGVAYKELLPINYSFRMTYEYVSNDKQLNLGTNPVIDFRTVQCSVKVRKTSNNEPVNNATVKYYSGAWRDLGTTDANGIATKELLPKSLSFRATYSNISQDKQQDISVNGLVEILLNVP
jgi:hypothetical protein